jgi:hypothetical protein
LPSRGTDGEDDSSECQDFASDGSEEDEACVAHGVHFRVIHLELHEQPAGVSCKDSEKDDQDDAGHDPHHSERRRERQHAFVLNISQYHIHCFIFVLLPFDTISAIIKTATMGHVSVL